MVLTVPLLLRFLGAAQFGRWAWLQAVLGFFLIVESALATTATVFLARVSRHPTDQANSATIFNAVLVFVATAAVLASSGLWLLSGSLSALGAAVLNPKNEEATSALRWGAVVVFARLAQQIVIALQQARGRFGQVNLVMTVQTLAGSLALVIAAATNGSLEALMVSQASVGLAALVLHWIAAASLLGALGTQWSTGTLLEMGRYGAMAVLVTLGTVLFMHGDRLALGTFLGATELGVYATLTTVAFQVNSLSAAAAQPLLAFVGGLTRDAGHDEQTRQAVKSALQLNTLIAGALSLGLAIAGPLTLSALVPTWHQIGDDTAVRIAACIYWAYSFSAVGFYTLQALGKLRLTASIVITSGLASIVFTVLGGLAYGLRGAIVGNLGYAVSVLLLVAAMKELGISAAEWTRWIRWPVSLVGAVLIGALIVPAHGWSQAALLSGIGVVFGVWLLNQRFSRTRGVR